MIENKMEGVKVGNYMEQQITCVIEIGAKIKLLLFMTKDLQSLSSEPSAQFSN